MNFGMTELLIILVIVIVIFGASRLPQIGRGLGEGIRNFKGALKEPPAIDVRIRSRYSAWLVTDSSETSTPSWRPANCPT